MTHTDRQVIDSIRRQANGRCGYCQTVGLAMHCHHLWPCGRDNAFRLDIPINLLAVCWVCHDRAHACPTAARPLFVRPVALREGLVGKEAHVGRQMERLRRAPPNGECRVCPACLGSCFLYRSSPPRPCGRCEGVGILDQWGGPWREVPRVFAGIRRAT